MSILLISLGTSSAIVPEAYLLPGANFEEVHVLTTASNSPTNLRFVKDWFAKHAPETRLTLTRVKDFTDFKSEQDHFLFEEVLYRWWVSKAQGREVYACLSGGFKTMSAAVQKAASIFGAKEVFHVLADPVYPNPRPQSSPSALPASTFEQIADSHLKGHFHWIRLGEEVGWHHSRLIRALDFPLIYENAEEETQYATCSDQALRTYFDQILSRSRNIANAWDRLGELPFSILATWPQASLQWLRDPVNLKEDMAWIEALPKIELHCHLGGFATHGEPLRKVRAASKHPTTLVPLDEPDLPAHWPRPDQPVPLTTYMKLGDANGSKLLKDHDCLRAQCRELYTHFLSQNIVYAEVRCSPANYSTPERSPWEVLSEIRDAFNAAMQAQPGCHVNLILIATRREKGDFRTAISRHLALAVTAAEHWRKLDETRVVAVDLAGYEDPSTRAHYFREEFTAVHRCGLALTVHAGENDDAEGIWSAVFNLNARRLGHALHLIDSPELLRSVADRGVAVEMCPFANYQIKGYAPMANHPKYPLKAYLDQGVRVTVNTDNIGISQANLSENLLLAAELCQLSRLDILKLISNAVDAAFESPPLRGHLRRKIEASLTLPSF